MQPVGAIHELPLHILHMQRPFGQPQRVGVNCYVIVYFMLGFFQDNYLSIHKKLLFIREKVLFYAKRQAKVRPQIDKPEHYTDKNNPADDISQSDREKIIYKKSLPGKLREV